MQTNSDTQNSLRATKCGDRADVAGDALTYRTF